MTGIENKNTLLEMRIYDVQKTVDEIEKRSINI